LGPLTAVNETLMVEILLYFSITHGVNFQKKKKPMHFIIMTGKPKVLLYIYPKIKLDKLKSDKKKIIGRTKSN
jgi:hypothetical protein